MMKQNQGTEGGGMGVGRMDGDGNHNMMAAPQSIRVNRCTLKVERDLNDGPVGGFIRWISEGVRNRISW